MNIPVSWIASGIVAAPQLLHMGGKAVQQTTKAFGDLLSPDPANANGHSELPKTPPLALESDNQSSGLSNSLISRKVADRLNQWFARHTGEASDTNGHHLEVNVTAAGDLSVTGEEPLRSLLAEFLSAPEQADLLREIRQLPFVDESPLSWMPGSTTGRDVHFSVPDRTVTNR